MKTFINSQALLFNNLRMYFIANKNLKSPHQMLKIGHNLEIVQRERERKRAILSVIVNNVLYSIIQLNSQNYCMCTCFSGIQILVALSVNRALIYGGGRI